MEVSSGFTRELPPTDDRVGQVLERAAAFYERFLRDAEGGEAIRARLERRDIDAETLRDFQIGYAPDDWHELLDELRRDGFTDAELVDAGVASESDRGHVHPRLRSRITFPVRDAGGRLLGLAGLATNPGPSWPEWLTTIEGDRFRRSEVLFGLDRARDAIVAADGALVVRDPVEVLRLHQQGRRHAVSTVRSEFGIGQLGLLAAVLDRDPVDLQVIGENGTNGGGLAVRLRAAGGSRAPNRFITPRPRFHIGRITPGRIRPDPIRQPTRRSSFLLQLTRVLVGIGIPLLWLAVFQPHANTPKGGTAFVAAVACVPVTYVLLTIVTGWVSGRLRRRSRASHMRDLWEDVLIGAAPVSFLVCIALFAVIFGFVG
jgi:DNA primase catalytic core, N-terminal domain